MKKILLTTAAALLALASHAAPLIPVDVAGSNITCMLSTNCTVVTNRVTDTFRLPNTTGEGILESLAFAGQTNAMGSNLYSYFYRIDLSGVTALNSNLQNCFTNVVTCTSNGPTPPTCVTNAVPCPGAAPCIEAFRIRFGPATTLVVPGSTGTSTGQVFVVTNGGTGTVAVASVQQTGTVVTVNFASPICPGSSSLYFGLVSSNAPDEITARLLLNNDRAVTAEALGPNLAGLPIDCDFSALSNAIVQLGTNDLLAPNNRAREGRRRALMNAVNEAMDEAEQGDLTGVLDALGGLVAKTGKKHKWFSDEAAAELRSILTDLLDCLGDHNGDVDDNGDHGNGNGNGHGQPNNNGNNGNHGNVNGNGNNGNGNGNNGNGNGNKPGKGPKK